MTSKIISRWLFQSIDGATAIPECMFLSLAGQKFFDLANEESHSISRLGLYAKIGLHPLEPLK